MKRHLYHIYLLLLLLPIRCYSQGLQFFGNENRIDERTSYSVFNNKSTHFRNQLSISFDISIRDFDTFGYIFRLEDRNTKQVYSFTYAYKDEHNSFFKFNAEGKDNLISVELDNSLLWHRRWMKVMIHFDLNTQTMDMLVNNQPFRVENLSLPDKLYPDLVFGKNNFSVEVASFSMQNLIIQGEKQYFYFPLNESEGKEVHDAKGKVTGSVTNPGWLINSGYYWKLLYEYRSESVSGVNFDEANKTFLFFNRDSLHSFRLLTNQLSSRPYRNNPPVDMQLGMSFIDPEDKRLYVYEVNNLPIGDPTVASLDLATMDWHTVGTDYLTMQLHHHTGFYNAARKQYMVFGGFGNQKYSNEFRVYDIKEDKWKTIPFSGDPVAPRFFTGMAVNDSQTTAYIFSGVGNQSGDQAVGRQYFTDLYKVDLLNHTTKKMWETKWKDNNKVPVRNMVLTDNQTLYALCYAQYIPQTHLSLFRFSIETGDYEILGDTIPIRSEEIATNANLYYSKKLKEFYCTTQEFDENGSSVIRLYSLADPPVKASDLAIYSSKRRTIIGTVTILLIILLSAGIVIRRRKRKQEEIPLFPEDTIEEKQPETNSNIRERNAIYIFGNFTVYDKEGKDITYMFSKRLKEVFLLILQHSHENGITSRRLSELLWPDKPEQNVKNSRGVTLNHLRKILAELTGIELTHQKGFFKLKIQEECYCDYIAFRELTGQPATGKEEQKEILSIVNRGKFLKAIDTDLLDSFKENTETAVLTILLPYMVSSFKQGHYTTTLKIVETIFLTDPLNDEALPYLVQALAGMKKEEEAQKRYLLFTRTYRKEMGEEYKTSFQTLLKIRI
ncbi:MAG: DNA-binding transcriptional activator [Tannerellaceae bacterium]|nr:DNA-binding transcriptional activator [Tannerellaceae bacterium]